MNTIIADHTTVIDVAAGRQRLITRPEPAPDTWVGGPLRLQSDTDATVVAVVGLLECLPIRPYAGIMNPPTGRWIGANKNGRLYFQTCDGSHLTTGHGPNTLLDRCDWTVGHTAWMFTTCLPATGPT